MPAVILGMKVVDRSLLKGLGSRMRGVRRDTLRAVAEFWHAQVFPRHFGASNRSDYAFEKRTPFYLNILKKERGQGIGRFRDEIFTGQSRRWMLVFHKITTGPGRATVRMFPPRYFTQPFIGSFTDRRTGKTKHVTRQPNKPDEVTRFNARDRRDLRNFAAERMQKLIGAARVTATTHTTR